MIAEAHVVTPEEIMAYHDGELSGERAETIAAHLQGCPGCQDLSGVLLDASRVLATWKIAPAASDPAFEHLLSEMAATSSANRTWIRPHLVIFGSRRPLLRWVLGSATVIALILGMISLSGQRRKSAQSVQVTESPLQGMPLPSEGDSLASSDRSEFQEQQISKQREALDAVTAQRDALLQRYKMEQISSNLANSQPTAMPQSSTPMIARTVSLSVVVKDFPASRLTLEAILARHRGYTANLNASTQPNAARTLQASLRIPATELSATVAELKALGNLENEAQSGEEVTHQHADLVARLRNSRETEQRLQAILVQRTGKIADVLAVEQEIARVRGEIEQMEAEQKSLEHRVDFATIDLNLTEEYKAQIGSASPSISTRFHNALVAGYRSAVESAVGIVLFFAEYAPTAIIWLLFLVPVAWFLRRRWLRATSVVS